MDGEEGKQTVLGEKRKIITYGEAFDKLCPYYMALGMSYDEYWHGDNYAYMYYDKKHEMETTLKFQERDTNAWLTGLYTYEAIADMAPILNAFAKKGTRPREYVKQPYFMKQQEKDIDNEKTREQKEREIENERLKFRVQMDRWVRASQKHFKSEQKGVKK